MPTAEPRPPAARAQDLQDRLAGVTLRDEHRLAHRLRAARRQRDPERRARDLDAVTAQVGQAEARIERRRAAVPAITYPEELPVSARRDEIAAAIRDHQVVVVAGETGSGKTTQLPKVLLEAGRGVRGGIAHTQPRRIAARSVAERIAEELGVTLGEAVGYTVRFTDVAREDTLVRLMTDGILLAEIQRDPMLRRYDTVVVDEAHERSLNVDFLLGYLARLLPRRPDLKVVVTSATIDPEAFSRHFGGAPVVEVSGRTYPVEVRYRPLVDPDDPETPDRDQLEGITDALVELAGEGDGDVLVFCSGEREIRDATDAVRSLVETHPRLRSTEVLPLFGRLSAAEQHRVFAAHRGRRVVLATNVAETSLTVPGIRYVVDTGVARVSRYSLRLKVQRLPIEPVSRASADQRAGRCGRVAAGVCIRLYSEADYDARPRFTDPEILRTNLASVILQMAALGLGAVEDFPFLEPPDRRQVRDGVALLHELGALSGSTAGEPEPADPAVRLTPVGRRLARLPLDPRLGRMVLAAHERGCVPDALVVVAALSIQDVRERPAEKRPAADEQHRRFADERSDLLAYLNLWRYLTEQQDALSGNALRRMCKAEFLHYLRVREWQDLVAQLRRVVRDLDLPSPPPGAGDGAPGRGRAGGRRGRSRAGRQGGAGSVQGEREASSGDGGPGDGGPGDGGRSAAAEDALHAALLAGLLSHVGSRDQRTGDYLGARGARFAVNPGSALYRKPPPFVMAAELVETTRLWARDCARVEPETVEQVADHLVQRSYSEPRWSAKRGAAVGNERVTLFGVPLVASRTVLWDTVEPAVARELFVRHALVEGDWTTHHAFARDNAALLEEVADVERRARRRDLVVDDEVLLAFYDARVPAEVTSARHFDAWWKRERRDRPDLLSFTREMLLSPQAAAVSAQDFPGTWRQGDLELAVTYQFAPGTPEDGVSVTVPVAVLNRLQDNGFDWQVPGMREDLVVARLRGLPKPVRTRLVPVPDTARAVLGRLGAGPPSEPAPEPVTVALTRELAALTGVEVPPEAWDDARVPAHLRIRFRVVDGRGRTLGEGTDLADLRERLGESTRSAISEATRAVETDDVGAGPPAVPRTVSARRDGQSVQGYPSLVAEGDRVAVRVLAGEAEQARAMREGTRALLLRDLSSPARLASSHLDNAAKLALANAPHAGGVTALFADCLAASVDHIVAGSGGPAWDGEQLERLRAAVRQRHRPLVLDVVRRVAGVLSLASEVRARLRGLDSPAVRHAADDVGAQLDALLPDGFVTATGVDRLPDVDRYLRAAARRLDKMAENPARDDALQARVEQVTAEYDKTLTALPPARRDSADAAAVRWMLEELRVSLFAQGLRTAYPISEKRIRTVLAALRTAP